MLTANIFIIICISLASSSFASGAKKDTVPSWLDTIAPRVEIAPKKLYQTTVFQIVLSANERSSLWIGLGSLKEMKLYSEPVSITTDGKYKIYYYAEDDFGNKSKIDSVIFVLDRKAPKLSISPQPGMYKKGTVLRISRDEECKVFVSKKDSDTTGLVLLDSLPLVTNIEGFLLAIDKAGNKSIAQKIKYTLDTTRIEIKVTPAEGAYNTPKKLTFSANEGVSVYYTFDPLAPPDWFSLYNTPVQIPHGANILRYFGRAKTGFESDISKRTYLLDTIPPKLTLKVEKGNQFDTIFLSSKEKATIWYTLNGETPGEKSFSYSTPIAIPQKGRCLFKAIARDDFGNFSEAIQWEYKYDKTPPVVTISSIGGAFTQPQTIFLSSNEDGTILYTLDRSLPDSNSIVYTKDGIVISKEDSTILRCIALDSAGNKSEEKVARFYLDTRAPAVRVKIEGTLETGAFNIHLIPNEISTIYYEIGDALPNRNSPIYKGPIPLITGQTLRYIAVDRAGNASEIGTMDELKRPMVAIVPEAGLYNKKLKVSFVANITGKIYWRLLPDTTFRPFLDSIQLDREGSHSIEYYVESASGLRSPFKRAEYFIDWTPPKTEITLRKGVQDSVSVLFTCSENASIYYTLDGSNPHVSATTKMGANKFSQSRDRISIIREQNVKLAFFAEDVSGNQSSLTVLDVFKPRAIPNVPAGSDRIYDRILSIELNTFSQSAVYYARHGKMPTTDSAVYTTPITLMESDTIIAFVVDASGFRGEADTFVYLIDLPPSPQFTVDKDTILIGQEIKFDSWSTIDKETSTDKLQFRWDFDGDNKFDTQKGSTLRTSFIYKMPGKYKATLEVTDANNRTASYSKNLIVKNHCPMDMVAIVLDNGTSFCIDKYEWPNIQGKAPLVDVSWVEAKMACLDAGKRLCTQEEWVIACNGASVNAYPYGDKYDKQRCPTEGKNMWRSGNFKKCATYNVHDMVGNAWEWVEDKEKDYPYMVGGSFRSGKNAQCGLKSTGTVAVRSDDSGFRCCK